MGPYGPIGHDKTDTTRPTRHGRHDRHEATCPIPSSLWWAAAYPPTQPYKTNKEI